MGRGCRVSVPPPLQNQNKKNLFLNTLLSKCLRYVTLPSVKITTDTGWRLEHWNFENQNKKPRKPKLNFWVDLDEWVVDHVLTLIFFLVVLWPKAGHGLLIREVSRPHNDAPQSAELLWTSDQIVATTSTWQLTKLTTNIHGPRRDSSPQFQQANGPTITP
jgi:hypothetical protein